MGDACLREYGVLDQMDSGLWHGREIDELSVEKHDITMGTGTRGGAQGQRKGSWRRSNW
jgi:hypothetical protein